MPAPQHYRVEFSGTLGPAPAAEIFSFGLSFRQADMTTWHNKEDLLAIATAIEAASWTVISPSIQQDAKLTRVRVSAIDSTGLVARTTDGAFIQADRASAKIGGSAAAALPWQIAWAVTTVTGMPGPTGRGRFYLPLPAVSIAQDGLVSTVDRNTHQGRAAAFVSSVRTEIRKTIVGAEMVVPSAGSVTKGLAPTLHTITGVYLGRRLDVQRRRANNLAEGPSTPTALT